MGGMHAHVMPRHQRSNQHTEPRSSKMSVFLLPLPLCDDCASVSSVVSFSYRFLFDFGVQFVDGCFLYPYPVSFSHIVCYLLVWSGMGATRPGTADREQESGKIFTSQPVPIPGEKRNPRTLSKLRVSSPASRSCARTRD